MRTLLYIISLFFTQLTIGQVKFDEKITDAYNNLFRKQPQEIRQKRLMEGFEDGFALVSTFKVVALNIKDIKPVAPNSGIKIVDIDEVTGKKIRKRQKAQAKTNL